ncbi:MAG: elongation factor P [Parcubacteria group bacterium Gr01-1014_2]|nr:MAG: elongation factor P [Parcubacteria group bacterium Gr01-1014_2]
MLGMNDLRIGTFFIVEGQPFEVLFSQHLKMQQRRPVMQTKIKNLITGKIVERNFQQSDYFEEADIQKKEVKFLYSHRDEFWFSETDDSSKRFKLGNDIIGEASKFLKPNTIITSLLFNSQIINIKLPVKMDFKVVEAPPSTRGNTAQGGTKQVKLETGAMVDAPLFINEGDIIRINTQTGEYAERVEKR